MLNRVTPLLKLLHGSWFQSCKSQSLQKLVRPWFIWAFISSLPCFLLSFHLFTPVWAHWLPCYSLDKYSCSHLWDWGIYVLILEHSSHLHFPIANSVSSCKCLFKCYFLNEASNQRPHLSSKGPLHSFNFLLSFYFLRSYMLIIYYVLHLLSLPARMEISWGRFCLFDSFMNLKLRE